MEYIFFHCINGKKIWCYTIQYILDSNYIYTDALIYIYESYHHYSIMYIVIQMKIWYNIKYDKLK